MVGKQIGRILARIGLIALVLVCVGGQAQAGTWINSIPASKFMVGGTANFFGTATRTTGSNGGAYISFAGSGDPTATFEYNIPSFLSSTTLTAQIYGRTSSTTPTNNFCFTAGSLVSTTQDVDSTWETNNGGGTQGTARVINPFSAANTVVNITGTNITFTPCNQAAGNSSTNCASVAECAGYPARVRVQRITTGCTDNDSAAFELIKLVLTGTTP